MPKPRLTFRLSKDVITLIQEHQQLFKLKNTTESLEHLILENDRLHLYIKYLGTIRKPKDVPQCNFRIFYDGMFYCAKKAPRIVKLPTLDICKACRLGKWNIPASTKAKKPLKQTIRNPNVKHQGMVYCINGGLWVFPSKCRNCMSKCRNYYTFMKSKST